MRYFLIVLSVLAITIINSCSKSSSIGSELVEQDQADVVTVDTFTIAANVTDIDSIRTYGPNDGQQLNSFLLGRYVDPVFGRVEAEIFTQVSLDELTPQFVDKMVTIDSVVLSLVYDTTKIYGNLNAMPQKLEVYTMNESLDRGAEYYSNQTFGFNNTPIGEFEFIPNPTDSVTYVDYLRGVPDTVTTTNIVRVPLSRFFGGFLVNDLTSTDYQNSDNFAVKLPGIHLRIAEDTEAMMGFLLTSEFSRINLYYTDEDGIAREYRYPFLFPTPKMNRYVNDHSGKEIVEFFDSPEKADSLIFIQGMAGVNTEIDIPYASNLSDVIINEAILEFFIASDNTTNSYPPIDRLFFANRDENGNFIFIDDLAFAITPLQNLNLFGGSPIVDEQLSIQKYRMNITAHFQNVLEGIVDSKMSVFPQLSRERADRVVIYGPNHPQYPMRLRVSYTKI